MAKLALVGSTPVARHWPLASTALAKKKKSLSCWGIRRASINACANARVGQSSLPSTLSLGISSGLSAEHRSPADYLTSLYVAMALTHGDLMFAKNLDEKLQKIQDKEAANLYIHNDLNNYKNKNLKMTNNRPQFITTVKKGVFLEPPPEVAALLGLSPSKSSAVSPLSCGSSSTSSTLKENNTTVIMYSYSSKPKVLHKNYHNDCSKSLLNNIR